MAGSYWDFLPTVLQIGASIYGADQASKSKKQAAQIGATAEKASVDAQLKGLEMAKEQLAINRAAASPGLLATQEIINRGSTLTPEQEQAVADSRTQSLNALKGSSLRGSARATSAVVSDTDRRVRQGFMDANLNRSATAATGLAGQYFGAGDSLANAAKIGGDVVSQGLIKTGDIQGANVIGQGAVSGQAIGDVGAIIADAVKENAKKERDSSYAKVGG
jgi:hypothetical protein